MSIIPGIDTAAPERTDTSSGSSSEPNRFPVFSSSRRDVLVDLRLEPLRQLLRAHERPARIRRDREPRRHAHAELRHLGQTDPLAAEEVAAALARLLEVIDVRQLAHLRRIFPGPGVEAVTSGPAATGTPLSTPVPAGRTRTA